MEVKGFKLQKQIMSRPKAHYSMIIKNHESGDCLKAQMSAVFRNKNATTDRGRRYCLIATTNAPWIPGSRRGQRN